MEIDNDVRRCATELGDTELMAKRSAGDIVAIEVKYHRNCLHALYTNTMEFMEDMHADEDNASIFKFSDVANLYKTRLEQLCTKVTNIIHTTRPKDRLLSVLSDLRAHSQARDILLLFEKDIGPALIKACDHYCDAMHLVRAAQVVRRDMFETRFTFDGAFQAESKKDSVTPSLLALVNMIFDGTNIKHQTQLANTSITTTGVQQC